MKRAGPRLEELEELEELEAWMRPSAAAHRD